MKRRDKHSQVYEKQTKIINKAEIKPNSKYHASKVEIHIILANVAANKTSN